MLTVVADPSTFVLQLMESRCLVPMLLDLLLSCWKLLFEDSIEMLKSTGIVRYR
jgi:hypothetical protein